MMEVLLQELVERQIMSSIKGVSGWARLMKYPQVCGETTLYEIGQGYGHIFSAALVKKITIEGNQATIILKGE